jgi:hypothetical protein
MKKKQEREWCNLSNTIRLPLDYKKKYYRCKCGKRVKVRDMVDDWDTHTVQRKGKLYFVAEIVFKFIPPHKKKVSYKNERK